MAATCSCAESMTSSDYVYAAKNGYLRAFQGAAVTGTE